MASVRCLQPIGGRIIVEIESKQEVSVGGIYLPQNAEKSGIMGRVLAVGKGHYNPHTNSRIAI